jgi:hypothetical protein
VFSERESGIQRWTDGYRWSKSRVDGQFLVYRCLHVYWRDGLQSVSADQVLFKKTFSISINDEVTHVVSRHAVPTDECTCACIRSATTSGPRSPI